MNLFGKALAVVGAAMALASAAPSVGAYEASPGSYANDRYGFSVQWDVNEWNGKPYEADGGIEGIELQNDVSVGAIFGLEGEQDNQACLDALVSNFTAADTAEPVVAPVSKQRPEAPANSASELYLYSIDAGSSKPVELVMFMGCAQLPNDAGTLRFYVLTESDLYWRASGRWSELFDGVTVAGTSEFSDVLEYADERLGKEDHAAADVAVDGIDGASFHSAEFGFGVSWEEGAWEASEVENDKDHGVELVSDASLVTLTAVSYDLSPERCLSALQSGISEAVGEDNFEIAPDDYERPELADGASGDLFLFVNSDSDLESVMYLECREIPADGAVLAMRFVTTIDQYEDELVVWQELLDSVETGS
jgi:hypothetical protein